MKSGPPFFRWSDTETTYSPSFGALNRRELSGPPLSSLRATVPPSRVAIVSTESSGERICRAKTRTSNVWPFFASKAY